MISLLIVDDELQVLAVLEREARDMGFEVHVATSVQEALSAVRRTPIDVVVTDLYMPGGNGTDLLKRLQEAQFDVPTVLMSAFLTPRDHEAASQLGVVRVIDKPFTQHQLRRAVDEALDRKTGFRGSIHGLSLIDFLQMLHYARRSVSVSVQGTVQGEIHIESGEIIAAECGMLPPVQALGVLMAIPSGAMRTSPLREHTRTIGTPFQETLLEALRLMDEKKGEPERRKVQSMRPRASVPPEALKKLEESLEVLARPTLVPTSPSELLPPDVLAQFQIVRVDEGWEDEPEEGGR